MPRLEVEVAPEHTGERLDRFLASVLGDLSRAQIQRLIRDERVRIHDGPRLRKGLPRANTSVRPGDHVILELPEATPSSVEPEDIPLAILYEDADLLVIDKPAGMVVHPAAGHSRGTLVNALLHQVGDLSGIGGELRPGIVHRLDRGTSGVMVVAKHDRAHEALARQFHDREVEKEYTALVWGVVQAGRRIDVPIGRDPKDRQRMSARARRARTAVTRVTHAEHFRGVTLVRVAIATGRTHQIRVHLSAIGHPLVGDSLYGGARRRVPGDLRAVMHLQRPFLHSTRIAFAHPRDRRRMEFAAPLPPDLQAVLDGIAEAQG